MKVYLAGQYSRRNEFRAFATELREAGVGVTSHWLEEKGNLDHKLGDWDPAEYRTTAEIDLDDIDAADAILFFAENPHVGIPRGGRHVEFGYAIGTGKRLLVIGGPENIFHYLPAVVHYPTLHAFIEAEGVQA